MLDYDGTLVPFAPTPEQASPGKEVCTLLASLAADKKNKVVIVSGRDKATLEQWLGHLDISLVAEHGVWLKEGSLPWQRSQQLNDAWKPEVMKVYQHFAMQLPRSFIEEKQFSIAWHYRNADEAQGILLAQQLVAHLGNYSAQNNLRVLPGHKVVETLCAHIGKQLAVSQFVPGNHYDFILAMGDDVTDEDMFKALPIEAFSVKIGTAATAAKLQVPTQSDALRMLQMLVGTNLHNSVD